MMCLSDTDNTGIVMTWSTGRHEHRVRLAARRAARCDDLGAYDDWVENWLKRCRKEALRAGHSLDQVNDWTMAGCQAGRCES